jgi:GH15 family glucan-1,4-alpha-glucosidase
MTNEMQPPIADLALLGDRRGAALVAPNGAIVWGAFERFDAHPVFAALLDAERGGHFAIRPRGDARVSRRYLGDSMVLETTFRTSDGVVSVTDGLALDTERPTLVRAVRGIEGRCGVEIDLRPRFEFGRTVPLLRAHEPLRAMIVGGPTALRITSSRPFEHDETCGCSAIWNLAAGEQAWICLEEAPAHLADTGSPPSDPIELLDRTRASWEAWTGACTYDGPYRDAVVRSALIVSALTDARTGAIVAAPTTSLPEVIGGVRNWDYRACWIRDSALDVVALYGLGFTQDANAYVDWLSRTAAGRARALQPVYGVGGERLLREVELDELDGYRGSRPVRIGNAAADQVQLDMFGELLDTIWLFRKHGGTIDDELWRFLCGIIDVVEARWEEADAGIWEARCRPEQWVSSKLFCWVAVDRAIRLADALGRLAPVERWTKLRDAIRTRIERDGVDPATGAFKRCLESGGVDATMLLVPLVRFLPGDDERVLRTIDRVVAELTEGDLVRRYRADDGLPGIEGAFVICSFWLVDALIAAGRLDEARERFERLLARANDVGILAEQIDPATGAMLGNVPQAFSHVGLIGTALNLARAERHGSSPWRSSVAAR